MGKKRNIWFLLVPLIIYIFIALMIFGIPLITAKKIDVGSSITNAHMWSSDKYKIELMKGRQYTITAFTDPFWGMDIEMLLYKSPFHFSFIEHDQVSASIESYSFTAERSGMHYIKLKTKHGSGFYNFAVTQTSQTNSGSTNTRVSVGRIIGYLLPLVILSLIGCLLFVKSWKINEFFSSISKGTKSGVHQVKSTINDAFTNPYHANIPVTYAASEEDRINELQQIIKRYKSISLEEMAQILNFKDTTALQNWLLNLPDDIIFTIDRGYVIIPNNLKEDSSEAEQKITDIAKSLASLKHFTCSYCGFPLKRDNKFCIDCGKEVRDCSVCKLPISFGDEIGKCSLCEAEGHLVHMQEWVKTQGKCPKCLQDIPIEGIIETSNDIKK